MVYRTYEVICDSAGRLTRNLRTAEIGSLPQDELLINVRYSPLNFKDALICFGRDSLQKYPITPGIDAIGVVVSSKNPNFSAGDEVAVCGGGIGVNLPGGFGEYISASAESAATLPIGFPMKTAALFGSAGITAALALIVLQNMGITDGKRIAVTNASFDAGSLALSIFSHLGYKTTAVVRSDKDRDFVNQFNIAAVKTASELASESKRTTEPLFDAVFDCAGGELLASLIGRLDAEGVAIAGGCYENPLITTSLAPFIDRGIGLFGLNGANCDIKTKEKAWQIIASDLVNPYIDWLSTEISIEEVEKYLPQLLSGDIKGRVVIDYNA
ncbi:MAG: zinc-binding dehydrogenase [Deferribacteraceae bacterium]|jgi:alcohol dehydrogenase|nr:zinc-binding dehydrogenase [Deferribacteraceae bacterium]